MHFTPLAASCSNSGRNASTADLSEKSMPPAARSSGDLVGTPAARTAAVSAPPPEKNSQKRYRLGSKAVASNAKSKEVPLNPSRCLLEGAGGAQQGALWSTEVPQPSAACAPRQFLELLPPWWPLPSCALPPLGPLPFPLPLSWLVLKSEE